MDKWSEFEDEELSGKSAEEIKRQTGKAVAGETPGPEDYHKAAMALQAPPRNRAMMPSSSDIVACVAGRFNVITDVAQTWIMRAAYDLTQEEAAVERAAIQEVMG